MGKSLLYILQQTILWKRFCWQKAKFLWDMTQWNGGVSAGNFASTPDVQFLEKRRVVFGFAVVDSWEKSGILGGKLTQDCYGNLSLKAQNTIFTTHIRHHKSGKLHLKNTFRSPPMATTFAPQQMKTLEPQHRWRHIFALTNLKNPLCHLGLPKSACVRKKYLAICIILKIYFWKQKSELR